MTNPLNIVPVSSQMITDTIISCLWNFITKKLKFEVWQGGVGGNVNLQVGAGQNSSKQESNSKGQPIIQKKTYLVGPDKLYCDPWTALRCFELISSLQQGIRICMCAFVYVFMHKWKCCSIIYICVS